MSQPNTSKNESIKKIEYQGQSGYFITHDAWTEIDLIITEYRILQQKYSLLEEENKLLYDMNTRLKKQIKYKHITNGVLTGSIGLNIALSAVFIGFMAITANQ
jgi:hypothetical protein